MLTVISPAKRLDWSNVDDVTMSDPVFVEDAAILARRAARLSRPALQELMNISPDLAKLNQTRFRVFSEAPAIEDLRPAMFAFAGDTYQGLEAATLDEDARNWAQGHLRILSGLYGLLRPADGIQPYRLEMGSRLKTRRGPSLYAYWGDRISQELNATAHQTGSTVLLNCASQEYFGAVDLDALELRVINPVFLEDRAEGPKIISFAAKRARGALARFVAERRIADPDALIEFDTGGYRYDPDRSKPDAPVFLRSEEAGRRSAA
ncbi:MAG: peroxide stress protein YaaA [Pseudomonadota bacterium]